ncbi:sensor domain-containing diguanylate cyclase [Salinispira pacifica]
MTKRARLLLWTELLLFALIIGTINLFFPASPGFFDTAVNPYLLLSFLIAAYYGRYPGFVQLTLTAAVVLAAVPELTPLVNPAVGVTPTASRELVLRGGLVPAAAGIIGVYLFGLIRDANRRVFDRVLGRLRASIRERVRMGTRNSALKAVNRELEERVLHQTDALTTLYAQVQELYSYNLEKTLDGIIETIQRFSGATSASVWQFYPDAREMRLVAQRGLDQETAAVTRLPVDNSIEGWVVRNDTIFSVRLLSRYANLQELDSGRNLMTLPVTSGRQVWGALNIEKMPFERYNRYTERLLQMILALVSPALEKAVEYESTLAVAEMDLHTGLPSYSHFHALLEQEFYRTGLMRGSLSVIIIELTNAADIREEQGDDRYYGLLNQLVDLLSQRAENRATLFHYKQENQLCLLFPNLDFDGASLFCLELLSSISSREWRTEEHQVTVDVVVGYAALGEKMKDADDLLQSAEGLLEMQKV